MGSSQVNASLVAQNLTYPQAIPSRFPRLWPATHRYSTGTSTATFDTVGPHA